MPIFSDYHSAQPYEEDDDDLYRLQGPLQISRKPWTVKRQEQSLEEVYNLLYDCATIDEVVIKRQTKTDVAEKHLAKESELHCVCRIKFEAGGQTIGIPEPSLSRVRDISRVLILNNTKRKYDYNELVVVRILEKKVGRPFEGIIKTRYEVLPKYKLYEPQDAALKKNSVLCIVHLSDSFNSWAQPVSDDRITNIILPSRACCSRAANGDLCYVKLLNIEDQGSDRQLYGKVVAIKKQANKLMYKTLLCRIVPGSYPSMEPLCGTVPRINYHNLHAQQFNADVTRKFKYYMGKNFDRADVEYESKIKFANENYVTLFSVQLGQDNVPQFRPKVAVKVNKDNCNKLFLVCYALWEVGYPYPLGKVISIIDKKDVMLKSDLLLSIQFSLPYLKYDEELESTLKGEVSRIVESIGKCCKDADREDFQKLIAITIDDESTRIFDDALTLVNESSGVYEVGVHVTDASYYIEPNSAIDRQAHENLIEMEASDSNRHSLNMLPRSLSSNWLSLVANKTRKCLSVFLTIKIDKNSNTVSLKSTRILSTLIKVRHNLTKPQVTQALFGKQSTLDKQVSEILELLWDISKRWRLNRLGEAAFYQSRKTGEPPVDPNFEARCVVEELMLRANFAVAEFLKRSGANNYPIKVQDPPREADVSAWLNKFGSVTDHSCELSRFIKELLNVTFEGSNNPILDRRDFETLSVISDRRQFLLRLFSEKQFSHLYPAIVAWYRLSNKAKYRVAVRDNPSRHFTLDVTDYVQFTSPLWRYTDLLVHRHLRIALKLCENRINQDRIVDRQAFESKVNERISRLDEIRQKRDTIEFCESLSSKAQRLFPAIVESISERQISLACLSNTKAAVLSAVSVNPSHLGLFSSPIVKTDSIELAWSLRIYFYEDYVHGGQIIAKIDRSSDPTADNERLQSPRETDGGQSDVILGLMRKLKTDLLNAAGDYSQVVDIQKLRLMLADVRDVESQVDMDGIHSDPGIQKTKIIGSRLKFHLNVPVGYRLNVQLCSDSQSELPGFMPQLVEICPNLCVCLQHRARPVPTLVPHALHGTSPAYNDLKHYSNVWLGLLQMESASASISDENVYAIHHVPLTLHWDDARKKHRLFAIFSLSEEFCQRRAISFALVGIPESIENDEPVSDKRLLIEASKSSISSDFVCIKAKETPTEATAKESSTGNIIVLHGSIALVFKTRNFIKVFVAIGGKSDAIPDSFRTGEPIEASVEVIKKPLPLLREELIIANLDDIVTYQRAKSLNNDNIIRSLIFWNVQHKRKVAHNAETYFRYLVENRVKTFAVPAPVNASVEAASRMRPVPCNESQSRAISSSLKYPISLVWGPPGTGKTLTGVLIAYWFSRINRWIDKALPVHAKDDEDGSDEEFVGIDFTDVHKLKSPVYGATYGPPKTEEFETKVGNLTFPVKTRRQVLYCGPSNRSVDVVVEYLREKLRHKCPNILRVFSRHFEEAQYPTPIRKTETSRRQTEVSCSSLVNEVALHQIIRNTDRPKSQIIRNFDAVFHAFNCSDEKTATCMANLLALQAEQSPEFRQLLDNHRGKIPAIAYAPEFRDSEASFFDSLMALMKLYEDEVQIAKIRAYQQADIVLCTTSSSVNVLMQKACKFTQIIIDEAGMCTQPEVLVPLVGKSTVEYSLGAPLKPIVSLLRPASSFAERLVLLGDHKQLRPIVQNRAASRLGFNLSFMEAHQADSVMLEEQYRMHPSLADFPAIEFYNSKLITRPSPSWTGVDTDSDLVEPNRRAEWYGLNVRMLKSQMFDNPLRPSQTGRLTADCVNIFHGQWPGIRTQETCRKQGYIYKTLPKKIAKKTSVGPEGEEDRLVFLHREGQEELSSVAGDEGGEFSRCNILEAETAVKVYQGVYARLIGSRKDNPAAAVAIISQYRYQVSYITSRLKALGLAMPTVKTVIACQGSEFDYVILSLVRSCPRFLIPRSGVPSWELKYLGFITDENQINVALTRARRGLIIIGNRHLLQVNDMWRRLLTRLERNGCILNENATFPTEQSNSWFHPDSAQAKQAAKERLESLTAHSSTAGDIDALDKSDSDDCSID